MHHTQIVSSNLEQQYTSLIIVINSSKTNETHFRDFDTYVLLPGVRRSRAADRRSRLFEDRIVTVA